MVKRLDKHTLRRYERTTPQTPAGETTQPPVETHVLVIGMGNAGEHVALRMCALAASDGKGLLACGINNDGLEPRPIPVSLPTGSQQTLALTERLVFGSANPRDQLYEYPLLEQRYRVLLRGHSVLETYQRAGYGGSGQPVLSALDIDLNIQAVQTFLTQHLKRLHSPDAASGRSDWERLRAAQMHQATVRSKRLRIVCLGGGSGSMGNAGHHLIPYLVRHLLHEAGITDYELWGAVLGPQAFTGFTPYTRHNYRALVHALDRLARDGQRRRYINDLEIALHMPPYDRLFVLDDPALGATANRVAEVDLDRFFDRSALALYLLLMRGTIWSTLAAHLVNDAVNPLDHRLRYLHTVHAAVADLDRRHLTDALTKQLEVHLLTTLAQRLGTQRALATHPHGGTQ